MSRLLAIVRSTWFRRSVIGLYVLTLALLIGAYIGISTFRVETATYLRMQSPIEKGRPNAMRGAVVETATGRFRRDVQLALNFGRDVEGSNSTGKDRSLGEVASDRWGVIEAAVKVPESVEEGRGTLKLELTGPNLPTFRASRDVSVVKSGDRGLDWPERTPRLTEKEQNEAIRRAVTESSGPIAVDILPRDGELVRGLESPFFIRTYERETGRPIRAKVRFETIEGVGKWGAMHDGNGVPSEITTDRMGLARVSLSPVGGQKLELVAQELGKQEEAAGRGEATVRLHTVPAQFSLSATDRLVPGGRPLKGRVDSLFKSKRLFVDLFNGRDWIAARSVPVHRRRAEIDLKIPEQRDPHWLYRLQIYKGMYGAGDAWESAWFVRSKGNDTADYRNAIEKLSEFIAEHGDDRYFTYLREAVPDAENARVDRDTWQRWLEAAALALPRHFEPVAPLFNTKKGDEELLKAWQQQTKGRLMLIIAAALVGALGVLLYIVIHGLMERREHNRRLAEVDLEMADAEVDPEMEDEEGLESMEAMGAGVGAAGWMDGLSVILLVLVALATFVMFGLGLLMVLTFM